MSPEPQKTVPAVENAAKILRHLARRGQPEGAAGVARATALSVSSTFNILKTLVSQDLVSFDPVAKTYRIGIGMLELATPLLGTSPVDLILPAMAQIAEDHKVMVALWQITDAERIILQSRVVPSSVAHVNVRPGARLPAYIGAIGRCYVAALGLDKTKAREKFLPLRWQTPLDFEDYWSEVQTCKSRGYAADYGNMFTGMLTVAAICLDNSGTPRLGLSSINIAGQVSREKLHEVGLVLKELSGKIERNLLFAKNVDDDQAKTASVIPINRKRTSAGGGPPRRTSA